MTLSFSFLILSFTLLVILLIGYLTRNSFKLTRNYSTAAVGVYKDQLSQVKHDLKTDKITEAEYEAHKIEISRRLIRSSKTSMTKLSKVTNSSPLIASFSFAIFATLTISISGGLYWEIGGKGQIDSPLKYRFIQTPPAVKIRPSQIEAETEALSKLETNLPEINSTRNIEKLEELVTQLKTVLLKRPSDVKGHQLLVENSVRLGDFVSAHTAQKIIIGLLGNNASSEDYGNYAELLILATNGYVSPEAEKALQESLLLNQENSISLYYYGLFKLQSGSSQTALNIWGRLVEKGPKDAPWIIAINTRIRELRNQIDPSENIETSDMNNLSVPQETDGETEIDMALINQMVETLANRIDKDGGSQEDWEKLIKSYGVLKEKDKGQKALNTAMKKFADKPKIIIKLRQLANAYGIYN